MKPRTKPKFIKTLKRCFTFLMIPVVCAACNVTGDADSTSTSSEVSSSSFPTSLAVASPFEYRTQALFCVPTDSTWARRTSQGGSPEPVIVTGIEWED